MHTFSLSPAMVLDTVLKSTVLLALAWSAALLLKNRSAATQHMVRTLALAAVLLLPFSVLLLPTWHVKGMPQLPGYHEATPAINHSITSTTSQATPAVASVRTLVHRNETSVATPIVVRSRKSQLKSETSVAVNRGESKPAISQNFSVTSTPAHAAPPTANNDLPIASPSANLFAYLPQLLIGLWIAGAIFFLIRWRLNAMRLNALVRRADVLTDSGWNAQIRALSASLGIGRDVTLMVSDEIEVPITTGTLYPRVILSPDYPEWSATRRLAILNHELAHINRLDALTQALGHLAVALYWFHPLVWLMVRAMRSESERACDDQVLAGGTKASDYAHELLDIVTGLRGPELSAALAMARRSQLEGRVLAVLNPALPRRSVSRKAVLALAVLMLCIVLPLSALRPAPQSASPAPSAQPGKVKPSPIPTPHANAQPAPAADDNDKDTTDVEAPEPPDPPDPPEPAEPAAIAPDAPEPPEPAEVQGVPSVPSVPAVPSVPSIPSIPSIPAIPAVPSVPGSDISVCGTRSKLHNMNMESDNGYKHWTANWSGDDCNLDLRSEGDIKFNAEATDIQSISSGGFFEVNLRQGDTLKQVKVTPSASGLQYVYKLNGKQMPFEGDAKTWFSQFLLQLERSTGFAADARVPALLAKGGPTAVLDEISNLQSDYVRGIYFRKLLEQPNLPSPVVQRVIKQAGEQIHSDYELARVLMTVSKQYDLPDEASRTAFLTSASKLKSDYEHSRVLIELLHRPNISRENVNMALKSSETIKSDYEKSRILLSLLDQKAFDQSELDFYLKMVDSIHSDYEKSRDLLAPMQKYKLATNQVDSIINATTGMQSDYEKSRLLLGLAHQGKFDEAEINNYLKVVDSMKSDYERSRSILELMQNNTLSSPALRKAIENMSRSGNDYEKSRVLTALVKANKFDESQMSTYIGVMDTMSSDYERARCLLALMDTNKLSNASLSKVIEEVGRIKTDNDKSRILLTIARSYTLDGALRDSYIKAADSISGEYERNRVLAAVVKRASL